MPWHGLRDTPAKTSRHSSEIDGIAGITVCNKSKDIIFFHYRIGDLSQDPNLVSAIVKQH